jgi:hypothetical protein
MSYKNLENHFPEDLIKTAIEVARACIQDMEAEHEYVGNVEEFIPHDWVIASICVSMQESYKSGYANCFAKYGKK